MEERAHLVSSIKAQLRSNAKETCAWLAHIASKQPHPKGGVEALSTASAPRSDQDKASGILAAAIMSCFQVRALIISEYPRLSLWEGRLQAAT